jgi:uncharacterized protein
MIWSRFNTLFHSEQFGHYLYNALSNTLMELDKDYYDILESFRNHECFPGECVDNDFIALLCENKIMLEDAEEDLLLLSRQYFRHALSFDSSRLVLTICPTLRCNFRCPYSFEHSQSDTAVMTSDTVDRILNFIKSYKNIRYLSLAWYGGEPLLAFDVIRDITEKIKSLDIEFEGAGIITNGYLLDPQKIAQLNDLKINSIQITLDGPEEVHDTRRVLAGGGPTYRSIINNVDALMNSNYKGVCTIRVNIDKHNFNRYIELRSAILEQFKEKKLSVYAGHINIATGNSYDHTCTMDMHEWKDFTFEAHRISGQGIGGFYPSGNLDSLCIATTYLGFVIGPQGELYKCWEDVGNPGMSIGSIFLDKAVTNPELQALYSIGIDAYSDVNCRECAVLPICGGGCANKRLKKKWLGDEGPDFCSPYKENLIAYLEAYIDSFRSQEICVALLSHGTKKQHDNGYRMISPEKKNA